ncbi:MAG: hypothetical protein ACLF0P_09795 [Thermoanaerobaculia bacterium]
MIQGLAILRRRLWVWVPALVFFAANLALLSTYRLVYADRVEARRETLEDREADLAELEERSRELSELVSTARGSRERLRDLYRERLATERDRFTAVTAEIRELARRAGLEPSAMSYPTEEIGEYGLVERRFTFSVQGTYEELRRFVNFLELTSSFVALEQVSLSEDEGARLGIRLSLSTLFVGDARARELAADGEATEGASGPAAMAGTPSAEPEEEHRTQPRREATL